MSVIIAIVNKTNNQLISIIILKLRMNERMEGNKIIMYKKKNVEAMYALFVRGSNDCLL